MNTIIRVPKSEALRNLKYHDTPNPLSLAYERFFTRDDVDRIVEATGEPTWDTLVTKCGTLSENVVETLLAARKLYPSAVSVIDDELVENFSPNKDVWAGRLLSLLDIARALATFDKYDNILFCMEDVSDVSVLEGCIVPNDVTVFITNRDYTGGSGTHWYVIAIDLSSDTPSIVKMCSEGIPLQDMDYCGSDGSVRHSKMRSMWDKVAETHHATIYDMDTDIQSDGDVSNCGVFSVFFTYMILQKELSLPTAINAMRHMTTKFAEFLRTLMYSST